MMVNPFIVHTALSLYTGVVDSNPRRRHLGYQHNWGDYDGRRRYVAALNHLGVKVGSMTTADEEDLAKRLRSR